MQTFLDFYIFFYIYKAPKCDAKLAEVDFRCTSLD